jgi:NitT/TauT family transport system permease protein
MTATIDEVDRAVSPRPPAVNAGAATLRFVLLRVVPLCIVLCLWQAVSTWLVSAVYLPTPTSIASRVGSWLQTGYLIRNCYTTLEEAISGFVLGAVAGALCGIALGMSQWWSSLFSPYINALYALPKVALGPLFILWFGIGLSMKIAMVGIFVFFVVFYNTWQGVKEVDAKLIEAMRLLHASRVQIAVKLIVPSALGWIFVGLRVSFPLALVGAIVGELIASNSGIGYVILNSANTFDTIGLFAGLFAVMVIAVIFDVVLTYAYGRYTRRWALQIKGVTALS